jgi:uncharacterized protein (DUF983 family)
MLIRGAFRRCPWCGGRGGFFVGWYEKAPCCQTCGLEWRRGDVGYELGAAAVTAIITFGPLMLILGGMVAYTWPDVEVVPMFAVLIVLAVALPLLLYGSAYLMWQAIDITMRAPTELDFQIVGAHDDDGAPLDDATAPGSDGP